MKKSKLLGIILAAAIAFTAGHAVANSESSNVFYDYNLKQVRSTNPNLASSQELGDVSKIILEIKNGSITSQQELTKSSEGLSDKEKAMLLSVLSGNLENSYDPSKFYSVTSVSDGFTAEEDAFKNNTGDSFGVCDQISNYVTRTGNEIGVQTASVKSTWESEDHAYNIVRFKDGNVAIINYQNLFLPEAKDVETALNEYQKLNGNVTFQYLLNNGQDLPEYKIITPDGENFLKFTGYDPSTGKEKDAVLGKNKIYNGLEEMAFVSDKMRYGEIGVNGFFVKEGVIDGDSSSPLVSETLFQSGFRNSFHTHNLVVSRSLNATFGRLKQDTSLRGTLAGLSGRLNVSSTNKKGLNFGVGIKGDLVLDSSNPNSSLMEDVMFYDVFSEGGISYTISVGNTLIKPYVVAQVSPIAVQFNNFAFYPRVTELETGVSLDTKFSAGNVIVNPYFSKTSGQIGGGTEISFGNSHINAGISEVVMRSTYEFAPDTYTLGANADIKLGNVKVSGDYSYKTDDYSGEITPSSSLTLKASIVTN